MECIEKYTLIDTENGRSTPLNILDATKREKNSEEQPKVEIERVSGESNSVEPKIKIERIDEPVFFGSTSSFGLKQEFQDSDTKTEVLSEEYYVTLKKEIFQHISNSSEQQYNGVRSSQNLVTQGTTKRKRDCSKLKGDFVSTTSRIYRGIFKSKELCKQCLLCGRVFLSPHEYFLYHLLCYHSSAKFFKHNLFHKRPLTKRKGIKNNRFQCKLCSKSFLCVEMCKRHLCLRSEGTRSCSIRFKQFDKKINLTTCVRSKTDRTPFTCETCSKQFSQKSNLITHMRCHTGEKPFQCEICLKQFGQKIVMICHMRCHTGEKPFKCEICLKQFGEKGTLVRHMRCHTGEKPFQCEICLKQFSQNSHFKSHMRRHTGEKPFQCEICYKQFGEKGALVRHTRCHTGEKPFKCDVCLKQFSQNSHFKSHVRSHTGETPFKCDVCLKQFGEKSNLTIHMRTHTGEKPFKCEICLKQFREKSNVIHHIRCHTGEKPFQCEICLKQFGQKCNLTVHKRRHIELDQSTYHAAGIVPR